MNYALKKSARHSVSSVFSVDYKKFVCIRVNSWFLKNDLVAANSRSKSSVDLFSCLFVQEPLTTNLRSSLSSAQRHDNRRVAGSR